MQPGPALQIGPYRMSSRLGEGGMGEVFRARDTRLNRDVAVKLLRADALGSPDRVARFQSEARAVSALNHPNILTIHDAGEVDGRPYIVSELVDGETLRTQVGRGPVGVKRLIDVAVQIADGLAAAHSNGITHRDLKPENIMITREGRVKVLDFGLAKVTDPGTEDQTRTLPGVVLGTTAYMSPEQARGEPVDFRSDQFSLGLILHEMATGRRVFRRDSVPETLTAILREEAAPLDHSVPTPLRWMIERLLAKSPEDRFASTVDLHRDLRHLRDHLPEISTSAASVIARPARGRRLWGWVAAGAALLLGAALLAVRRSEPPDVSAYRFSPITRDEPAEVAPRWSPDGKSIAYAALIHGVYQIFVRTLGSAAAAQITRSPITCMWPSWSADGSRIYYLSGPDVWAISASGGTPQAVMRKAGVFSVRSDDRTIAFSRGGQLHTGELGGDAKAYAGPGFPADASINAVQFSPDGSKLAVFGAVPGTARGYSFWELLFPAGSAREAITGLSASGFRNFAWFPDNRRLLFSQIDSNDNTSLLVQDLASKRRRTIFVSPVLLTAPAISPDGTRIAVSSGLLEWNVIDVSLKGAGMKPMITRAGIQYFADWHPSGKHYLFATNAGGTSEVADRSASDGFTRHLVSVKTDGLPSGVEYFSQPRWSPEGDRFVFLAATASGDRVFVSNAAGGRVVVVDPSDSGAPAWSPDGQWLAYVRRTQGKAVLMKAQPGAPASATPFQKAEIAAEGLYQTVHWSGAGILYPGTGGLTLIDAEDRGVRVITGRRFSAYGFSRDGRSLFGIFRNTDPKAPEWGVYVVDVASGHERFAGPIELPATVSGIAGLSVHPEGDHFATSVLKLPYDIWMLENFDAADRWMDRLGGLLTRP